jgi:hypothetical protein
MFLRCHRRKKDAKEHPYSIEERRLQSGSGATLCCILGEINDSQQAAGRQTLEVLDEQQQRSTTLAARGKSPKPPLTNVRGSVSSARYRAASASRRRLGAELQRAGDQRGNAPLLAWDND